MVIELYQYFQFAALLVSIFCYKSLKSYAVALFISYLVLVCVTETVANYVYYVLHWDDNAAVYNIYLVTSPFLFFILLKKMLNPLGMEAKLFYILYALVICFIVLNYFFIQGAKEFNSYSIVLISFISIIISCLILMKLSRIESRDVIILKEPFFWISAGHLLFFTATLVTLGLRLYILTNNIEVNNISIYRYIMPFANVILYASYTGSFILCKINLTRQEMN